MWSNRSLVALALLSFFIVAFGAPSPNPRCASHVCTLTTNTTPPFSPFDNTSCAFGDCPRCLVGPEWEQRLQELGAGTVRRTFRPTISFYFWLTALMSQTMFRILVEEALGMPTTARFVDIFVMDVLCCKDDVISIETWDTDFKHIDDDSLTDELVRIPIGYEGGSGLFVAKATLEAYPLATSISAYRHLPEYQNIFPKGYSTPCIEATINKTLGCVEGNFYCNLNKWTNTTCAPLGRYVPPQCEADPTSCQEVYMTLPTEDPGVAESMIKNNGFKMIGVYLSVPGLRARVRANIAAGVHSIFHAFEPSEFLQSVGAERVVFPQPTGECELLENPDPTLNLATCDNPRESITKVARRESIEKDADFAHLFKTFSVGSTDINKMLRQHRNGGGNMTVYDASCQWLKDNYPRWSGWIKNTPSTDSQGDGGGVDRTTLIAIVMGVCGGALTLVLIVLSFQWCRTRKALKHAPRGAPMAIIFTDVESSTTLWERYGSKMGAAIELHNALIRECIEEFHCYEVKIIGDAFVIASARLVDAAMCCLAIQTRLMSAPWPSELRDWKGGGSDTERQNFSGLRVRMSIHYAVDVTAKLDVVHGRYDYLGPDMNVAARVESLAAGGQTLMTNSTHVQLVAESNTLDGAAVISHFASGVSLKGVAVPVTVFSMVPATLSGRTFGRIVNPPTQRSIRVFAGEDDISVVAIDSDTSASTTMCAD